MPTTLPSLALLALAAAVAHPGQPATAPAPATAPTTAAGRDPVAAPALRLERIALANGLRAYVLRDPAPPMVGVFAVIRAGLRHEARGEDGLSHFLEHLLFNGTGTMSQEQLYAAVDRIGGYSNATTRDDHTVFQMLVPKERLEVALGLHAAMLFDSTLPPEKLDKERGIVLEEIAKDAADPGNAAEQAFRRLAFAGTPLERPVLGSAETLGGIGREAVVGYWKRRYTPASVEVLVVGNAERHEVEAALERTYGRVPPAPAPLPDAPIAPDWGERGRLVTLAAATGRLELVAGWLGPDPAHPDAVSLDVLAALLSEGPGPSLERQLESLGMAGAGASASLERAGGTTIFVARAHAPEGTDPAALLAALNGAVVGASEHTGSADLEAVRTRLAVRDAFLAEQPHYFGLERASLLLNAGAGAVEGLAAAQRLVDPVALVAASSRWLAGRPVRAVAAGPGLESSDLPLATPGGTATAVPAASAAAARRRSERLAGGTLLSVAHNPVARVFSVHVLVRDRALFEGRARSGLADLVHRLLPRRGEGFERALGRIGAVLKTSDDPGIPFDDYYDVPDYGYLRLQTLDDFAEEAMALLMMLLEPPRPSAGDLAAARSAQVTAIRKEAASAAIRSERRLAAALCGEGHPLAASPRGAEAVVAAATAAEIEAFAREYLAPGRLIVTVETGRDPDWTFDRLAARLGGRSASSTPADPAEAPPPPRPAASPAEERLGGPQSYVRLGALVELAPEERAPLWLAVAVLGERLAADVREQRGMAYSIGSRLTRRGGDSPDAWSAAAGTRPENADEVREAMLEHLRRLHAEGPEEEELALAAGRLAGRELMRNLTGIGRAYHAGLDLWRGDPPGRGVEVVRELAAIPRAAVVSAIRRHLDPARARVVVVR